MRRRFAVFVLFFLPGLSIASWVTRTPDIRDTLNATTAEMGLVLFGLSVGSMIGILFSGVLVARWGAKRVIVLGTVCIAAGVSVVGMGASLSSATLTAVGLGIFGLGMGGGEVALNVEGADVERKLRKSTLPAMHGFFSLGTVTGALAGMGLTAAQFPIPMHLLLVSSIVLLGLIAVIGVVSPEVGRNRADAITVSASSEKNMWKEPRLMLIGGIVLALALAEGTANDWLPLVMVDGHGFDATWGSAVYVIFAASMTVGRFVGGTFVDRYGRPAVLCFSALVGATGIGLVIFVDVSGIAAAAAVLWGLGAALGFPVALSAAADSGPNPTARVAQAAMLGYLAFLAGPPSLGFLGEAFGLRQALIVVLVVVVIAAFLAPFISSRTTRLSAADRNDRVPS